MRTRKPLRAKGNTRGPLRWEQEKTKQRVNITMARKLVAAAKKKGLNISALATSAVESALGI